MNDRWTLYEMQINGPEPLYLDGTCVYEFLEDAIEALAELDEPYSIFSFDAVKKQLVVMADF